ncbi:pyruvate kinase [Nadsonia fulvescens var. elongata DSM 6958]|uniref:Pyruvate kinase n=1 Tax=Nadsonia fulvescens var. elongata DSM 6958 TaxID=857566 RepID=A0A1E3PQF6_9ASCO|nr:pyruvate kinase [Nadsonia fulvescens var. elongata DSM 6958]
MIFGSETPSSIQWLATLDTADLPIHNYRRSAIVGTVGPSTNSAQAITSMRQAGLNILRLDLSKGNFAFYQSALQHARESEQMYHGRPLAIAIDTTGSQIYTGLTKEGARFLVNQGHEMIFSTDEKYMGLSDDQITYFDYSNVGRVIGPGKKICLGDGFFVMEVLDVVDFKTLKVRALSAGEIVSKMRVHLPGTKVDLPALSQKDLAHLQFAVDNKVDILFASFIRSSADIVQIRQFLRSLEYTDHGQNIPIIAKIENQQGIDHFDEILREADGILVARGSLGVEIPVHRVLIIQKQIIAKCNLAGKPAICATQMLDSMTYNPRPTRAEISDVGNAILDGADCVMLTTETAVGKYPVESVSVMVQAALVAEKTITYQTLFNELRSLVSRPTETVETIAISTVSAAFEQQAGAILVLSTSGTTARLVAKYRPYCPILMVTRNEQTARYSHLYRGVYPFLYKKPKPTDSSQWQNDVEQRLKWGMDQAVKLGVLSVGDVVVAIQGWTSGLGHSNTLRILECV